eukprot:7023563-Pyramimonas_sp.AAC.1
MTAGHARPQAARQGGRATPGPPSCTRMVASASGPQSPRPAAGRPPADMLPAALGPRTSPSKEPAWV